MVSAFADALRVDPPENVVVEAARDAVALATDYTDQHWAVNGGATRKYPPVLIVNAGNRKGIGTKWKSVFWQTKKRLLC